MKQEKFEQWAIVELFGHQKLAGLVTEAQVGGCSFVRVDVPNVSGDGFKFTRLLGNGAIYAINFVLEEIARAMAQRIDAVPVYSYELPQLAHKFAEEGQDELPY